jgi:hypothetical protein
MKFLRNIIVNGCYGMFSIPKPVFNIWTGKNYTRVEMIYDSKNDTLVVVPIYGD